MRWRRRRGAATGLIIVAALAPAVYGALSHDRARQLEVYQAFLQQYGEGERFNVADATIRFDASLGATASCAPDVLLTTAISRHFRTTRLEQTDFADSLALVVDAADQALEIERNDPLSEAEDFQDLDAALDDAFAAGSMTLSEVGFDLSGRRAVFSFEFRCGSLCGHDETVMFERSNNEWVRSDRACGDVAMH